MKKSNSFIYPLLVIGMLFFVFGFLTWINGILIPYFKICMNLNNLQATLVAFSSYSAYFVMSLPSAWVLKSTGYKKGISNASYVSNRRRYIPSDLRMVTRCQYSSSQKCYSFAYSMLPCFAVLWQPGLFSKYMAETQKN